MPMLLMPGCKRPPVGGGVLAFGTPWLGSYNSASYVNGYSFPTGVTGVTGYGKAIVALLWNVGWSWRNNTIADFGITLNGAAVTKILDWSFNTGSDRYKYGQITLGWIDSPANGTLAYTASGAQTNTIQAVVIPVDGAGVGAAGVGTPATALQASSAAALENSLTVAGGHRLALSVGRRNHSWTWNNANLETDEVVGFQLIGAGNDNCSGAVSLTPNLAPGAEDCGGDWSGTSPSDGWSSAAAVSILAA